MVRMILAWMKRNQLAAQERWCRDLEDQIESGRHSLYGALQVRDRLRAELCSLESPRSILKGLLRRAV